MQICGIQIIESEYMNEFFEKSIWIMTCWYASYFECMAVRDCTWISVYFTFQLSNYPSWNISDTILSLDQQQQNMMSLFYFKSPMLKLDSDILINPGSTTSAAFFKNTMSAWMYGHTSLVYFWLFPEPLSSQMSMT